MNRFFQIILIVNLIGFAGFIFVLLNPVRNSGDREKTQDRGVSNGVNSKIIFEEKSQIMSLAPLRLNEEKPEDSEIIFYAVGDIMLDRGVDYMIKKNGNYDFKFPFLKIADYLKRADILFGNLESIISDKGVKVGSIYSFRAEPEAIEGLIYAGFDIISVANNHVFDYEREAMEDSFKRLREVGIDYVGGGFNEKEVRTGVIREIKETKITFLAYTDKGSKYWAATEKNSGIGWLDERIKDDIEKAKDRSDLVIVSFHTGEEYQAQPNKEQEYFSHLAIDSGADLVIGHHPHIIQPIEKYPEGEQAPYGAGPEGEQAPYGAGKNGWIAYSLGNFVFDQGFSKETMEGLLLEVIIENKKIKEVTPKKVEISEFFQPYLTQDDN